MLKSATKRHQIEQSKINCSCRPSYRAQIRLKCKQEEMSLQQWFKMIKQEKISCPTDQWPSVEKTVLQSLLSQYKSSLSKVWVKKKIYKVKKINLVINYGSSWLTHKTNTPPSSLSYFYADVYFYNLNFDTVHIFFPDRRLSEQPAILFLEWMNPHWIRGQKSTHLGRKSLFHTDR